MRNSFVFGSSLLAALVLAPSAHAADWFVSPTGTATSGCTTRSVPCSLGSAASAAAAGDNVILMDGIYKETLFITVTGTADAILHVLARDMRHLEEALERIRSAADVERSESIVVLTNIIDRDRT